MSVHQLKNGTWYVQYRVPGVKSPRKEYTGVGPDAEKRARIRDREIAYFKEQGRNLQAPGAAYLDSLAQSFLVDRKTKGSSDRWLQELKHLLNIYFLPSLTHCPVDKLTYANVIELIDKHWGDKTLATRQRYLAYLKSIFTYGVKHELTTHNPLGRWNRTKEAKPNFKLTLAGLEELLKNAPDYLKWTIEVAWELGARPGPSELFSIKYEDFDFEGKTVIIRGTKTLASNRIIPLSDSFIDKVKARKRAAQTDFLIEYRGRPLKKGVRNGLKAAAERANLGYPVRMYDIRHLFATTLLNRGADLAAVSALLGHSNIQTTQVYYYHLMQGEKERAITVLPELNPQD